MSGRRINSGECPARSILPLAAAIAAFSPTDNLDGTYTWLLGDIEVFDLGGGQKRFITIEMQRECDAIDLDWGASGKFHNTCENDTGAALQDATGGSHSPLMILDGNPTLHLVPQKIYAVTPNPVVTAYIVNGGSGALYDADLMIDLE